MVIMTQTLYIQPHSSAVTTAWNVPHHARTHARTHTHRLASGRQEAELRGSGRKDQSEEEKSEKEGAVDRRM